MFKKALPRFILKLAPMLVLGILFAMWPSGHAIGGTKDVVFANYPMLWFTISIAYTTVEAVKFLLVRAKLLRTDTEVQVREIYDNSEISSKLIKDLHDWHSPSKTPTGTEFGWKGQSAKIELIKRQNAEIIKYLKSRRE